MANTCITFTQKYHLTYDIHYVGDAPLPTTHSAIKNSMEKLSIEELIAKQDIIGTSAIIAAKLQGKNNHRFCRYCGKYSYSMYKSWTDVKNLNIRCSNCIDLIYDQLDQQSHSTNTSGYR